MYVAKSNEEGYVPLIRDKNGNLSTPGSLAPDLKEEIDRKAHDTLSWLIMSAINDKITDEQFSIGVDVLFMAVSGLAGPDFIEKVTQVTEVIREARERLETDQPKPDDFSRNDDYGVW